MENQALDIKDYLKIVKRRKIFIIVPFFAILLLSTVLAVILPSVYRSSATILIEEQEIPSELVRSTVTTFADQRIQIISQRIMSRANLKEIKTKFGLYTEDDNKITEERIFEKMRKSIKVETVSADVIDPRNGVPTKATIAFTLAFDNPSAQLAQKVTNELVSLFLKENIKSRTDAADNAAFFFTEEKKRLKDRIIELQNSLGDFKEKNLNQLPEANTINQQELSAITNQLMILDSQERSALERRIYIEGQLAEIEPNAMATNAVGNKVYDMHDRLKELQSQYPSTVAHYSDAHPDVVKLKREIDTLQKEIGSNADVQRLNGELSEKKSMLAMLTRQYSDKHPDVIKLHKEISALNKNLIETKQQDYTDTNIKPNNPAFIGLQTQLSAIDSEVKSLAETRRQLNEKMERIRHNLHQTPLVEKEYMDMLRELENTQNRYKGVDGREMEAQIAQQLEQQKKGERFTLIDPPQEPLEAFSPNRLAILLLGVVLAIAGGFGCVALAEILDSTVHTERAIAAIMGVSPLATIPYLEDREQNEARNQRIKTLLIGCGIAAIIALMLFHFTVMPLDVFWFKLLRVLDIT